MGSPPYYSCIGYLARAYRFSYSIYGWLYTNTVSEGSIHEFFNIADINDAMAAAELDIFAFANIIDFVLLLTWAFYEFQGVRYLRKLKGTISSIFSKEMALKKVV